MSDADSRRVERIAKWMSELGANEYELRCKGEVIDTAVLGEAAVLTLVTQDLIDAALEDCDAEGKARTYTIVGILPTNEQYVCPIKLRFRPNKGTSDAIIASLAKANTELHEALIKERKEGFSMLLTYAETVSKNHSRIVKENERLNEHASEVITRLENLRTKELERKMAREKHEKDIEIKDRITDGLLPLAMAIGHKVTRGALPPVDLTSKSLTQIAKAMTESQLEIIKQILGAELGDRFLEWWTQAVDGNAVVPAFRDLLTDLSSDQMMAVQNVLSMPQQAALKEVLADIYQGGTNGRS